MGKSKKKEDAPDEVEPTKKGEYIFPNNDTYKGEYEISEEDVVVKHGYGNFKTVDGIEYTGTWENDKMCGKGYLSFPDGSFYEGEFQDNQFEGQGSYTWPNGCIYKGTFVNNKLQGDGIFIDNVNQTWAGSFHYKAAPGLKFVLNM